MTSRIDAFPLFCLFILCLTGCGGDGGGNRTSPFAGRYQGTFTSSNATDQGTVTMSVDDFGDISGTLVDDAFNPALQESMSGTIDDNGNISGDFVDNAGSSPYDGNLGFDTGGNLTGPVSITTSTGVIDAEFNLTDVTPFVKRRYGKRDAVAPYKLRPGEKALLK